MGRQNQGRSLRTSLLRWQKTFNAMGDALCILDVQGRILKCNQAMEHVLGRPRQQIIGCYCWEAAHGSPAHSENCPFVRMLQSLNRETLVNKQDARWLSITAEPILDRRRELNRRRAPDLRHHRAPAGRA